MKKRTRLGLAAAAVCLCWVAVAPAEAATEEGWRVRVNGFVVDTDEQIVIRAGGSRVESDTGAGGGGGVSGEYRFSERWGIEFGAFAGTGSDFSLRVGGPGNTLLTTDTMGFGAGCVGFNFHLTPTSRVDLYAGPLMAYMSYDNIRLGNVRIAGSFPFTVTEVVSVSTDSDLALGVNLGIDVPFGETEHWFFNADMKYLDATIETGDGLSQSADFDPFLVGIGVGYAF